MKFTSVQLKKINRKVNLKYGSSVVFNNDLLHTRVVYTTISIPTDDDKYTFGFLTSLLNTEKSFDDVYFSI